MHEFHAVSSTFHIILEFLYRSAKQTVHTNLRWIAKHTHTDKSRERAAHTQSDACQ